MTRPLHSAPITEASALLRAGPSARHPASHTGPPAGDQPPARVTTPSHVPTRSGRPGSRRLHAGHRQASQRAPARLVLSTRPITPVLMSAVFVTTRQQRFACARLPDPHLTHPVRLFLERSPRRSSANAARGGLEPPRAGRLRRAFLHLPNSTITRDSAYLIEPPSMFVTHGFVKRSRTPPRTM